MSKYIMRLDDACPRMDTDKWERIEAILDKYGVHHIVGVIPDCQDPDMDRYPEDPSFWQRGDRWKDKGWCIAMHGCTHVYSTDCGVINPVNARSEFAGEPLEVQEEKIRRGVEIMRAHGIEPKVFFAPAHTFDGNTLAALKNCSGIRIISDTVANAPYSMDGFTFVPQQSGRARKLPIKWITCCYHPNAMTDSDFDRLEAFLAGHASEFIDFPTEGVDRPFSVYDGLMRAGYYAVRAIKIKLHGRSK